MASKEEKALWNKVMQAIDKSMQPQNNPAQDYLTKEALAGADYLKKGEFSAMPNGMFFDFESPAAQLDQYKKFSNVGAEGTFALGAEEGAPNDTQAYLTDKFARDASLNYQNNIKDASGTIKNALAQSAGAKSGNDSQVIGALQSMMGNAPKGFSWSSLLPGATSVGNAVLKKFL